MALWWSPNPLGLTCFVCKMGRIAVAHSKVSQEWGNNTCTYVFLLHGSDLHSSQCIPLKRIRLSERSRSQKATCCIIAFIWFSRKSKIVQTENRWVVAGSWGCREGLTKGHEGIWQVIALFCPLIVVAATPLYVYAGTFRIAHWNGQIILQQIWLSPRKEATYLYKICHAQCLPYKHFLSEQVISGS